MRRRSKKGDEMFEDGSVMFSMIKKQKRSDSLGFAGMGLQQFRRRRPCSFISIEVASY